MENGKPQDALAKDLKTEEAQRERNYFMPVILDTIHNMQIHIRDGFPVEDSPAIFGLHPSATQKAIKDFANDIMYRTYLHQFVIKRSHKPDLSLAEINKNHQRIHEFYRQKLLRLLF